MMTDELYEACALFLDMLKWNTDRTACEWMLDLLCNFDEWRWNASKPAERKEWLEQYIPKGDRI